MKKQIIILILCICMVITLMPVPVRAVEPTVVLIAGTDVALGGYWKNRTDLSGIDVGDENNWNVRYSSGTLFLNNLELINIKTTTEFAIVNDTIVYAIFSDGDLTVNLNGESLISTSENTDCQHNNLALGVAGNLTIMGSGSLCANSSNANGTDEARSYGVYSDNTISISDGKLTGTAAAATAHFAWSCGVSAKELIVTGGEVVGRGGKATAGSQENDFALSSGVYSNSIQNSGGKIRGTGGESSGILNESIGVCAEMTISTVDTGDVSGLGGQARKSFGIYSCSFSVDGGMINATGGSGIYSYGIYCQGNAGKPSLAVSGGSLTASGGRSDTDSFGIWCKGDSEIPLIIVSGGSLTASGGIGGDDSYGIYAKENDLNVSGGNLTASGGTATDKSFGVYVANGNICVSSGRFISNAVNAVYPQTLLLPEYYEWRTSEDTEFIFFPGDEYIQGVNYEYLEVFRPGLFIDSANPTTVADKEYDGNTKAEVSLGTVKGILLGDDVSVTVSGVFDSPEVGYKKAVTVRYSLTGEDAYKYAAPTDDVITANIIAPTPKYTVSLPADTAYTLTPEIGSETPVTQGGSFSFKIKLNDDYEKGTDFAVKANGLILFDSGEIYTIDNISADQTITVEGVVLKGADYSKTDAAIGKIPADLSVYTDESVQALLEAKNAVERDKKITQQTIVDGYAATIEKAIMALEYKGADYSKTDAAIGKIPADLSVYTDESVQALLEAKNAVEWDKNITQQTIVDGYAASIEKAINNLVRKPETTLPEDNEPLSGDVNGDGKVKANDARTVLRYAAGLDELSDKQKIVADVNSDGKIKANDARLILRIAAGLIAF